MPGVPDLIGHAIGNYRLERLLGSGGMGDVYLGVHPQIGSRVAVKVLHAEHAQDRTSVERFLNEARAVNTIRHDAIVNVLDLGTLPDGRPYLVMEYHDGAVLGQLIRQRGPLPLAGAARVVGDVLDGLAAAHRRLIIHRDLKPDNVWVTVSGRAYVLDFGLAKLVGEKGTIVLTRKGAWLGTPYYMAPEQIDGRKVDPRTDLYSVGVILFHACTGRLPFEAPSIEEVFRMHLATPPPAPRALRRDLPPSLEAVILRALAKDPGQRFGSAKEMVAHLRRAAAEIAPGPDQSLNVTDTLGPTAFPFAGPPGPTGSAGPPGPGPALPYQATAAATAPDRPGPQATMTLGGPLAMAHQTTVVSGGASAPAPATLAGVGAPAAFGAALAAGTLAGLGAPAARPLSQAVAAEPGAISVAPAPAPARGLSGRAIAGLVIGAVVAIGGLAGTIGFLAGRAGQPEATVSAAAPPRAGLRATPTPPAAGRTRSAPAATAADLPPAKISKLGNITLISTQVSEETLPPGGLDPRRFDALGFRGRAQALAAARIKDPVLVGFEVNPVAVDGRVDLAAAKEGEAEYTFRTRAVSGAECPVAVVKVTPKAIVVSVNRGETLCQEAARPAWRCSLAQAGQLARRQGAKPIPAKVSWLADGWFFDFDDAGSESVRDTCR